MRQAPGGMAPGAPGGSVAGSDRGTRPGCARSVGARNAGPSGESGFQFEDAGLEVFEPRLEDIEFITGDEIHALEGLGHEGLEIALDIGRRAGTQQLG